MILIVILALIGGIKHFSSVNQEQVEDQPTPTSVRHDNSGAGSSTEDNTSPIQEHMQRGLHIWGFK